jgi:small-conductance mechanosensitive channel
MDAITLPHLLVIAAAILVADFLVWRLPYAHYKAGRVILRSGFFTVYSIIIISSSISPFLPPPWLGHRELHFAATILALCWWIFAARTLTEAIGVLMPRIGHSGRLLQDVIGALAFLLSIVAAAAYVLELPIRGLLVTSGALAIIVGLAIQSTLSDVFSGIVLNATKPYQVSDWIIIDGMEGKVTDIDWRATHLLTGQSSTVVIPNSVAAKAKITNLSRPADLYGVSVSILIPVSFRPQRVMDALLKALKGASLIIGNPEPRVQIKQVIEGMIEYEAIGFVSALENKGQARNLLFDLAHRHLASEGIFLGDDSQLWSRQRALLEHVKIFYSLSEEDKDRVGKSMKAADYSPGQIIMDLNDLPDYLSIIGSGVVLVELPDGNGWAEAGRMGPGEVMGEQSILTDTPSEGRCTALTNCTVYRIEKETLRTCMAFRDEIKTALVKLHLVREQNSRLVLTQRPVKPPKSGFLSWFYKR